MSTWEWSSIRSIDPILLALDSLRSLFGHKDCKRRTGSESCVTRCAEYCKGQDESHRLSGKFDTSKARIH